MMEIDEDKEKSIENTLIASDNENQNEEIVEKKDIKKSIFSS